MSARVQRKVRNLGIIGGTMFAAFYLYGCCCCPCCWGVPSDPEGGTTGLTAHSGRDRMPNVPTQAALELDGDAHDHEQHAY